MEIPEIPVEKVLRRRFQWYVAVNVQAAPGLHGSDDVVFFDSGAQGCTEVSDKSALLLGATGLTGSHLLHLLLEDDRYSNVVVLGRSSVGLAHEKLEEKLVDLLQIEQAAKWFTVDEVYCCIGTTAAKTPDRELYRKIDFGIPVQTARLCKQAGVETLVTISAMGADSGSPVFYNRTKGEMEDAVKAVGIRRLYILRPSLIGGARKEQRPGESMARNVLQLMEPLMIGGLRKYRAIEPQTIARAMLWLANNDFPDTVLLSDTIEKIGHPCR